MAILPGKHALALAGCYVISLRPAAQHAALRRAAALHGARTLAFSPWRLALRDDDASRRALRAALSCSRVLFTSPNAVHAARRLQPLHARRGQQWLAVGEGTARALLRAGIRDVLAPERMDSDGLLALPPLQALDGTDVGLVTAPGGRGLLNPELRRRGARVHRADVYARVPIALSARALAALRALRSPAWLALSSGEALEQVIAQLPADAQTALRRTRVVAASARLADLARAHGFEAIVVAASARPRDLVAARVADASASMRGIAAAGPIP